MLVGSATPGFYVTYAIKGNAWHNLMGGASFSTGAGSMILYYFASLDRQDNFDDITNEGTLQQLPLSSFKSFLAFMTRRENRSLAIVGLWLFTCEVSIAIGGEGWSEGRLERSDSKSIIPHIHISTYPHIHIST